MGIGAAAIRSGRAFVEILADDTHAKRVLRQFQTHVQSWSTTLNSIGRALLLPAIGLALPMRSAIRTFADFEQEMAKVKARLDATDSGFKLLRKSAIELGQTTAFTATQAAQAMTKFAEAGYESAKIATVMKPAIDLAAAGLMDLDEAANIIITTLNTFNLKADQIPHAVDILASAAVQSASDVRELGQSFVYASAVASTAGIPLQHLVGALSLLHDAGIKADIAGTTMRGAILALTQPTDAAAKMMQQLGIRVQDTRGNMRDFPDIIADFQRSLARLGSAQKLTVIGTIFDARQAAGFAKLVDFGADRLRQRIDDINKDRGRAAEVAKTQLATFAGEWRRFVGSIQATAIELGDIFAEPLSQLVTNLRGAVVVVRQWIKENPALVKSMAGWLVGIMAAAPALITLSVALNLVAFSFSPIIAGMSLIKVLFAFVIASVTGFGAALLSLSSPFALLGIGVIFILRTAMEVSRTIENVIRKWGQLTRDTKLWTEVVESAVASGKIEVAFESSNLFMRIVWAESMDFMRTEWENFTRFFADVWDEAITTISEGPTAAFKSFIDSIKPFLRWIDQNAPGEKLFAPPRQAGNMRGGAPGNAPVGQFSVPPEPLRTFDALRNAPIEKQIRRNDAELAMGEKKIALERRLFDKRVEAGSQHTDEINRQADAQNRWRANADAVLNAPARSGRFIVGGPGVDSPDGRATAVDSPQQRELGRRLGRFESERAARVAAAQEAMRERLAKAEEERDARIAKNQADIARRNAERRATDKARKAQTQEQVDRSIADRDVKRGEDAAARFRLNDAQREIGLQPAPTEFSEAVSEKGRMTKAARSQLAEAKKKRATVGRNRKASLEEIEAAQNAVDEAQQNLDTIRNTPAGKIPEAVAEAAAEQEEDLSPLTPEKIPLPALPANATQSDIVRAEQQQRVEQRAENDRVAKENRRREIQKMRNQLKALKGKTGELGTDINGGGKLGYGDRLGLNLGPAAASAVGTFNAFAASGLGGANYAASTAKYTEETAKGVKKLNDKPGAMFS